MIKIRRISTGLWIGNRKLKLFLFLSVLAFFGIFWKLQRIFRHKYNNDITMYSASGYWRGNLTDYHSTHFGPKLAGRLLTFFINESATSIIDLGGGGGLHAEHFIRNGIFASCYDGNPESQDISHGICATVDLAKPIHFVKSEWVLSLSVGRQIPPLLEDQFIKNIHNLNTQGVVIFWGDGKPVRTDYAYPKNVKNNTQVVKIFEALGYDTDSTAAQFLRGRHPTDVNYSLLVFRKIPKGFPPPQPVRFVNFKVVPNSDQDVGVGSRVINIAVTSCGLDKMDEALTMIKSAILFSQQTSLRAFIFVDTKTMSLFKDKMRDLTQESKSVNPNFEYEIRQTNFPTEIEGMTPWKTMFKPCSLQRLFLPTILNSVDAIIYMDADSIFLSNLTDFWNLFSSMKPNNFIGATQLTEFTTSSWFQNHSNIPHYGERGLNTGISLMNLTRMRSQNFSNLITLVRKKYEYIRPKESGDQFLQNILYSFYPEYVSEIPCEWNLRPLYCRCEKAEMCACNSALKNGVAVIHGTRNAFSDDVRLPFFKDIYQAFHRYNFSADTLPSLLEDLTRKFNTEKNKCFFNDSSSFYKRMEAYTNSLQG